MSKRPLSHLLPFFLVLCGGLPISAQVTIWMEDFSGYPNATLDSPGKWTSDGTDCDDPGLNIGNQFGVFNGQFVVNEVEGAPCCAVGGGNDNRFETVGIDIADYCDVEVSLITAGSGGLDCLNAGGPLFVCLGNNAIDDFHDQMLIEIQVDGVVVQSKYICGVTGLGAANFTGITGNTLVIRIFVATKFGSETYTFDNIEVTGNAPSPVAISLPNTVFCPAAPAVALSTNQGGITGGWTGPGVNANNFSPANAGVGVHTLTFTPNAGQCRTPNTIDVTVLPFPPAFPTAIEDCTSPLTGQAVFNLTSLNDDVNGASGNAVSWYSNAAGTIPIPNPANFTTTTSVTVYARVTDNNGCVSNPVPITVTVNSCNIALPNLSCSPVGDVNTCNVCEDAIPGVDVTLYINIAGIPPGGYDITVTYTGPSGAQSEVFTGYTGGPLNFNIEENTTFSLSEVVCPNGCIDQFGLGDQVNFQLVQTPQINNPGPQSACNAYTLPPITGQNLPPGVAYFTLPNGGGVKFLPGGVITDSTLLYIFANNGACSDQESFPVNITPVSDTTLLLKTTCDTAQAGITVQTLQNASGCDSIVVTTTTLVGSDTTFLALNSCNPQDTGIVVTVLQGLVCDSVVITVTSLLPSSVTIENLITCNQANAGSDTLFLSNVFGCDSVVISNTVYVAADTNLIVQYSCNPQDTGVVSNFISTAPCGTWNITTTLLAPTNVVSINNGTCNQALVGIDTVALVNQFGCDSLIITTTIFTAADTTLIQLGSCNPQDTGVVVQLLQGVLCDSFVITQTTLLPADTVQLQRASCNPAAVGVVDSVFINAFGCSSLAVITTTLLPADTVLMQISSCDSAQVGVVDSFYFNTFGCLSIVRRITTLLPSDVVPIQRITCDPALAGVVDSMFVNSFGCNSLAVITTTLLLPDTIYRTIFTCDSLIAGITDSLVIDPAGCQTHVITAMTYTAPLYTNIKDTLCTGDSLWINGVAYHEGNPSDTVVLKNALSGCDSAVLYIDLRFEDLLAVLTWVNPNCKQEEGLVIVEDINGQQTPYMLQVDNDSPMSFDTLPYAFYLPVGNHDITIPGTGTCAWTQSIDIQPAPSLFIDLGLDEIINLGEAVFLSPSTNFFPASFAWQATDTLPCYTCPELLFQPTQSMLVTLLATDSSGCTASDSMQITVSANRLVYLPNVFSPESADGLNDVFFLSAAAGQVRKIVDFQIFDRWGGLIFGRKNILPNDRSQGWDGTYKGDDMMPGVYIYYLEVEFSDGVTEVREGDVTLLR